MRIRFGLLTESPIVVWHRVACCSKKYYIADEAHSVLSIPAPPSMGGAVFYSQTIKIGACCRHISSTVLYLSMSQRKKQLAQPPCIMKFMWYNSSRVYNSYGKLISSTNNSGAVTTYANDTYGNLTSESVGYITNSYSYNNSGISSSSIGGINTTYTYTNDQLASAQTLPKDALQYSYSATQDSISSGNSANYLNYTNNILTSMSSSGNSYNIATDSYLRPTSISIGDQVLTSYQYNATSDSTTTCDSTITKYYDMYGRVTDIVRDGTPMYSYVYGVDGATAGTVDNNLTSKLTKAIDKVANVTYTYDIDGADNVGHRGTGVCAICPT